MSCSMTVQAVLDRTKTVTRRRENTWQNLQPGETLTLIEKGMGLKPGEKHVVLCDVTVVDVRVESLMAMADEPDATRREGFPEMSVEDFAIMWLSNHRYEPTFNNALTVKVRRIEWKYLKQFLVVSGDGIHEVVEANDAMDASIRVWSCWDNSDEPAPVVSHKYLEIYELTKDAVFVDALESMKKAGRYFGRVDLGDVLKLTLQPK